MDGNLIYFIIQKPIQANMPPFSIALVLLSLFILLVGQTMVLIAQGPGFNPSMGRSLSRAALDPCGSLLIQTIL